MDPNDWESSWKKTSKDIATTIFIVVVFFGSAYPCLKVVEFTADRLGVESMVL